MEITVNVNNEGKAQNVAVLPQADLIKGATGYMLAIHLGAEVYSVNVSDLVSKLALAVNPPETKADDAEPVKYARDGSRA